MTKEKKETQGFGAILLDIALISAIGIFAVILLGVLIGFPGR
jgi:hypothetical protein